MNISHYLLRLIGEEQEDDGTIFDKELAAREVPRIPGMLNLIFLFIGTTEAGLRKISKRKKMLPLGFP